MESSFSGPLRGTATDGLSSGRQGADGGEQVADLRFVNASRDEHEPAGTVVVRPGCKLDRRMREVLYELHEHRAAAAGDVEQALHAQEVGTAQRQQRLHRARKRVPGEGGLIGKNEAHDAVAVLGFRYEA